MKHKKLLKQRWFSNAFALCIAIVFYELISNIGWFAGVISTIFSYISPVLLGLVFAYIMSPLVKFFENTVFSKLGDKPIKSLLAIVFSFILVIVFIAVLLVALIPQVVDSVVMLVNNLPTYISSTEESLSDFYNWSQKFDFNLSGILQSITDSIKNIVTVLPESVSGIVEHSVNFGKGAVNIVLAAILAIYFLIDAKKLKRGFKRIMRAILPEKTYDSVKGFWYKCDSILIRYIACDLLDGLIIGLVNGFVMFILGLPYAVIISFVVGVTNLAPTFGPIIGAVIGGFILLIINPWYALWFIILTIILQTADAYVIKPKLFGDSLGISGLWILVGIVVGGRIFGVIGILLAIPAVAIIDYFYQNHFICWLEEKRGIKPNESDNGQEEAVDETEKG
ncbi:MAG: AI-2E family transporter [Lachnospiraceae bacterium]|nr:AI-2E family transporter [Lachnospiraceae bacterium]